jgi:uncharacterized membrane protein
VAEILFMVRSDCLGGGGCFGGLFGETVFKFAELIGYYCVQAFR